MTAEQPKPFDEQSLAAITAIDRQFFHHLIAKGATSRAAIAADIGISRPTASESAKRLLKAAIIKESGVQGGQRGRAPVLYDINPARGHTLSLAMDHDWIGLRVCNLARHILWERVEALGPEATPELLVRQSRALLCEGRTQAAGPCLSATCSVADPVDPGTGQVIDLPDSPFPAGHVEVGAKIFGLESAPLLIDNDVNWAAFAESRIGLMQSQPNFLYVFIGAGIGAALYVNGAIYRGASGLAGEIGYLQVAPGKTLAQRLIELEIASSLDSSIDTDTLIRVFENEPLGPRADAVIDALAWAIANTTIALNPAAVILAGRVVGNRHFHTRLSRSVSDMLPAKIEIKATSFGAYAPLTGATLGAQEQAERCLNLGF